MIEQSTQGCNQKAHWENLRDLDGTIPAFPGVKDEDFESLFGGFVIDGSLPEEIKDVLVGEVYPFKRIPYNRQGIEREKTAKQKLKTDNVLLLYIPAEESTNTPLSTGFVAVQDLFKNPDTLLIEEQEEFENFDYEYPEGISADLSNFDLVESKSIAFRAIMGVG